MREFFLLLPMLFLSLQVFSQGDRIVGYWLTEDGEGQVVVFKTSDGKYNGKIIWLCEAKRNKKDDKNPDEKLRSRSVMGINIVSGLIYNPGTKEWTKGLIYDPKTGNTYDSYAWFDEDNNDVLHLKGFVMGMRFIGRTTVWKREKDKRP